MTLLFAHARKVDRDGVVDDFWMRTRGDRIVETGRGPVRPQRDDELVDVAGRMLTPGFIDLHSHGGGGGAVEGGVEEIATALATHRAHGTTRSVLSLVSAPLPQMSAQLALIADLVEADPLLLGSHAEGPFLAPTRRGAHDPDALCAPDSATVDALLAAARGTLRQMTIAPELPGGLDAIARVARAGVLAAIGHTDASAELAREAFDRGARILTHAFNAMPGIHHRSPGPVSTALADPRVTLEIVLDGIHVDPTVARIVFAAGDGRVAIVTDAMAAAGAGDGEWALGAQSVSVRDGVATVRGTDTIAGSTLTLDCALRIAIEDVGLPPADAVAAVTAAPARALGLDDSLGMLSPGFAADAVILGDDYTAVQVWGAGRSLR